MYISEIKADPPKRQGDKIVTRYTFVAPKPQYVNGRWVVYVPPKLLKRWPKGTGAG